MRWTLVFLLACSPEQKPVVDVAPAPSGTVVVIASAPSVTASAIASPVATATPKPSCPATFGGGPQPSCNGSDNPGRCMYPQGSCFCGHHPHCGGAAPRPTPGMWICDQPKPACPAAGTPCTGHGSCSSGPCSWSNVVECINGTWTRKMIAPPP